MAVTELYEPKIVSLTAANDEVVGKRHYTRVSWVGGSSTNQLVLKNKDGDTVVDITLGSDTDQLAIRHLEGVWVNGLKATTIGGGTVYAQYE